MYLTQTKSEFCYFWFYFMFVRMKIDIQNEMINTITYINIILLYSDTFPAVLLVFIHIHHWTSTHPRPP